MPGANLASSSSRLCLKITVDAVELLRLWEQCYNVIRSYESMEGFPGRGGEGGAGGGSGRLELPQIEPGPSLPPRDGRARVRPCPTWCRPPRLRRWRKLQGVSGPSRPVQGGWRLRGSLRHRRGDAGRRARPLLARAGATWRGGDAAGEGAWARLGWAHGASCSARGFSPFGATHSPQPGDSRALPFSLFSPWLCFVKV